MLWTCSYTLTLGELFLVSTFKDLFILCAIAVQVLMRLCRCAGSPEHSLIAFAFRQKANEVAYLLLRSDSMIPYVNGEFTSRSTLLAYTCEHLVMFHVCLLYAVLSVSRSLVITCWEKADLLALSCVCIFLCFCHFPICVLVHIRTKGKITCLSPQVIVCWPFQGCASFVNPFCHLCFMIIFVMLSFLFLAGQWSPAGMVLMGVVFSCV